MTPMRVEHLEIKPESAYVKRFVQWWIILVTGVLTIVMVVKGIALIMATFGSAAGAFAICAVACAVFAAIVAQE